MSRFANPSVVKRVELGPCDCKDQPHSGDWVEIRSDISGSEIQILINLPGLDQSEQAEAIAPFIVRWNLTGPEGEEWSPSPAALFLLNGDTAKAIGLAIAEVVKENVTPPNRSGAPSRASSRGSASRTPITTLTPGT